VLVFVIPLKSKQVASSWELVSKLFERCVKSVCNQTSSEFGVIVVCHETPETQFHHPHLKYIEVELPIPQVFNMRDRDLDKGAKATIGLSHAQEFSPSHVMIVDADDCVSKHLAEFVRGNPSSNGWFLEKGYEYQEESKLIYLRKNSFYLRCGTSNIVNYQLYPKVGEKDWYCSHHKQISKLMLKQGNPMQPLPFPGAVYALNHGENLSYQRNLSSLNPPRFPEYSWFLHQAKATYKAIKSRSLTKSIREEFGIYPLTCNDL